MARKQKDREILKRELDSLRGKEGEQREEPPVRAPPQRKGAVAPPKYSGSMRPGVIILIIAIVFSLCIVIFFMGVQVNDLNEQNAELQSQIDQNQQTTSFNYTASDAIESALADDWVAQNIISIEQKTDSLDYDMRTFAVLTTRAEGTFWNVLFVGLDCDCEPPTFNSILALVNARTGEVPQAYRGTSMNETAQKEALWLNLTISFWP